MSSTHPNNRSDLVDDEELNLAEYVGAVWRYRFGVILSTVLVGVAIFAVSWFMPPVYEANARLAINASKISDIGAGLTTMIIANYRALFESPALAQEIVTQFQLDKQPYNLTPARFLDQVLTADVERDTNIIVVKARLSDADLAAKVANSLAERAVGMGKRLSQSEAVTARDDIRVELDAARRRLTETDTRLETFKKQNQLELLRRDVEAILTKRLGLLPLLVDIKAERARLAAAQEQLGQKHRIDTVKRSIDNEPAMIEAARTGRDNSVLPIEMKNEFVNPVYESLEKAIGESQMTLAGLEQEKADLIDARKLDTSQLAKLNELYTKEAELQRIQIEYDLARKSYTDAATKYEQSRLQVLERAAQMQILDRALAPERPVSPKPFRNGILAMTAAFILAIVLAVIVEALQPRRASTLRSSV